MDKATGIFEIRVALFFGEYVFFLLPYALCKGFGFGCM